MPRPSNREERRGQILDAFCALIQERGYDKATTALIAERANLTSGLIHYHFKSKEEILVALIERLSNKLEARLQDIDEEQPSASENLHRHIRAYLELGNGADPHAVSAWVMVAAEAAKKEEVRVHFETAMASQQNKLSQIIADLLREREKSTADADRLASGLLSSIQGIYLTAMAAPSIIPHGFASSWMWEVTEQLIDNQPEEVA